MFGFLNLNVSDPATKLKKFNIFNFINNNFAFFSSLLVEIKSLIFFSTMS